MDIVLTVVPDIVHRGQEFPMHRLFHCRISRRLIRLEIHVTQSNASNCQKAHRCSQPFAVSFNPIAIMLRHDSLFKSNLTSVAGRHIRPFLFLACIVWKYFQETDVIFITKKLCQDVKG